MSDCLPTREETSIIFRGSLHQGEIVIAYVGGRLKTEAEWCESLEELTNEIWVSETFGAYRVIDEHGIVVDTVTDLPRRKAWAEKLVLHDD